MTRNEIEVHLLQIGKSNIDFDLLLSDLAALKVIAVADNNQEEAKQIWILEQVVKINSLYVSVFNLLKSKSYYDAWCKLEKIEIKFLNLKQHFTYDTELYKLHFIEKSVTNLQTVFPYQLFFSTEILELEKRCNICDQVLTIRNSCGHKKGEIYNGELCIRIISKSELLGISVVENPVHKYAVAFTGKSDDNETTDQYNYAAIDYLMELVSSVYEDWNLEIQQHLLPHSRFKTYGRNDLCPCGSREKYKKCCLLNKGVKFTNYEFIVDKPSDKKIATNTINRNAQ